MDATDVVHRFIGAINDGDVERLGDLMTEDHEMRLFDETPLVGRAANVEAWRGYCTSFPAYLIHPHRTAERAGVVAVLGHTTGSHLGLPDAEEEREILIWLGTVEGDRVRTWELVEDSVGNREVAGLASMP